MRRCGCEDGDNCTKTTVCAVESAVQDATENLQAVVDAAVVYCHKLKDGYHGRADSTFIISKSLKNLHEEVAAFEEWEKL